MMKTMKFFSMAALALVGAVMTGCSSSDDIIETPQQPASRDKVITVKTTVSLSDNETRALTAGGVKTFAEGEKMALVYTSGSSTAIAVSEQLTTGGTSATFTFELTDPVMSGDVTYIYPAAMANTDGSINYDALATQDGTLASLSSNLDLATKTSAWSGTSLPSVTLENQLAILALKIKVTEEITSTITGLTISDGTNNYAVTREAAAGPIYVAIRPTSSAAIDITATDGTKNYTKSLTDKTYLANNFYNYIWNMTEEAASGPQAVDLGLSVLWANMNVGATSPEGYGDYFAWGETEPYYTDGNAQSTEQTGIWKTGKEAGYKWPSYFDVEMIGESPSFTNSKYKYDRLTTLDSTDDAATAKWGNGWRMPTKAEFDELLEAYPASTTSGSKRCAWLDNYNNTGVKGLAFYDAEDNIKLFLPAAGYRRNTLLEGVNEYGFCMSSSLCPEEYKQNDLECGLNFAPIFTEVRMELARYGGYPVRPVRARAQ